MAKNVLIIGGSDAGVMAALNLKELAPEHEVTVILADEYPNHSICGLPYAVSGKVEKWEDLAHRKLKDLTATGVKYVFNTTADSIDPEKRLVYAHTAEGAEVTYAYDELVVATGARPRTSMIKGLEPEGSKRIHVMHTMQDFFKFQESLEDESMQNIAIVGAGYIGLEMAEALRMRRRRVTMFQMTGEVLDTIEPDLGAMVRQELIANGVEVRTNSTITELEERDTGVDVNEKGTAAPLVFDMVLVVVGVQPNSEILAEAGAKTGIAGSVVTNDYMQTSLPHIWAAGDVAETKHRLLGRTYISLGTTSHKQGRIAALNIAGKELAFEGSLGTQVLTVFDLVIARTGLLEKEAVKAGFDPFTTTVVVDDHKAYYPGAQKITIRITGDKKSQLLLGAQLIGYFGSEIPKRTDIYATAIYNKMTIPEFSHLDLTYSPKVGAPWDAVQEATQTWEREFRKAENE
ncbi:MAG: FAD-dependent oxidoreductase [Eubacteriales bacterium]|nr:FAD-dependent oxidoreductase [Eubacteriales bacterium]